MATPASHLAWTDGDLLLAVRGNPESTPELLAVAAVHQLGDGVRRHTAWLRDRYPEATPDGLARLAVREYVRLARVEGALAGLGGAPGVLAESAALPWLQAKMVLRIAAAYGRSATAAELLVLQQIHASVEAAETAIRDSPRRRRGPVGRFVARALVRALAARIVPAPLVGGMTSARLTEQLAMRATSYYRPRS